LRLAVVDLIRIVRACAAAPAGKVTFAMSLIVMRLEYYPGVVIGHDNTTV